MKKILSLVAILLLAAISAFSQNPAPGIFNYQGVARNSAGNALINKAITLRLTIYDGSAAGPVVYQESRSVTTNPFGLFNVQVGSAGGSNVTGTIAGVNLGAGNKFIQVEIDANGGTAFINIGAAQIASVPYSLYSSLANDLVLPFNKTQADAGALFKIANSGSGITLHTTGPVRLQGISEGVNRILASDAAGHATWKDPAAVNIVTGNGTFNFVPKWTPTGTNLGNSQIVDNGAGIGINTATPNASAQLDISSTTKGILIPRMTTAQRTAIASPANALLVFDNNTASFWFYNGAAWTEIFSSLTGWSLTGNAGTNPAVNFIGTTDNNDVVLKRNNIRAGFIGTSNTSFGLNALNPASTGFSNTANGASALRFNTTGNDNTANGRNALGSNTTGDHNTANGAFSLAVNTTGIQNTANGARALFSNTTGSGNSANGYEALYSNTTGNFNTANGAEALRFNTTGNYNTGNGSNALGANTTGGNNTANGFEALFSNTTGNKNTANGSTALHDNTAGNNNTANGADALSSNTNGGGNTANGVAALGANTTGSNNTANGFEALSSNTTGFQNTANGVAALGANTGGFNNTANGFEALSSNTIGVSNTAYGYSALVLNTTGSNNTGIGNGANVPSATGDNQVRIGNAAITYAGVEVAWTITSDKRKKTDIKTSGLGLDFIKTLHPVSYYRKKDDKKKTEYGFLAQEVEEALNKAGAANNGIITKDDAGMYSVRYNDFIAPMVKAIQEQQAIIQTQQKQIDELKLLINKLTANMVAK